MAKKATAAERKKQGEKKAKRNSARTHRKTVLFNDAEMTAIAGFCRKYKITSQAKFFREIIITTILRKTEEDHPKLF